MGSSSERTSWAGRGSHSSSGWVVQPRAGPCSMPHHLSSFQLAGPPPSPRRKHCEARWIATVMAAVTRFTEVDAPLGHLPASSAEEIHAISKRPRSEVTTWNGSWTEYSCEYTRAKPQTIAILNSHHAGLGWVDDSPRQMLLAAVSHFRSARLLLGKTVDSTPTHCTYSEVQSVHKRGTHLTRLAQGPARVKDCSDIFVRLKRVCHLVSHMSQPLLLSHLPRTTSTYLFSLLSTSAPEQAEQSGQHDKLQDHPVHHQLLQKTHGRQASLSRTTLA